MEEERNNAFLLRAIYQSVTRENKGNNLTRSKTLCDRIREAGCGERVQRYTISSQVLPFALFVYSAKLDGAKRDRLVALLWDQQLSYGVHYCSPMTLG